MPRLFCLLSLCCLTLAPTVAHAQSAITRQLREEPIVSFDRTPDELEIPSLHYRGFILKPALTISSEYNDNIFLSVTSPESDLAIVTAPELSVIKTYRDHAYSLDLRVQDRRYLDIDDENSTSFQARMRADIQASKALKLPFELSFNRDNLDRTAPGEVTVSEITQFDTLRASAGMDYQFNRLNLELIGHYERQDFENGRNALTSAPILFESRDRSKAGLSLVGTYDVAQDHAVFAGVSYERSDFDRFLDGTGADISSLRSNDSINILAGLQTSYKGLLIGDIGIGYIVQNYDSALADTVTKFDVSADLSYLITPKLTLNFEAAREINQNNDFVQGVFRSHYLLGAEYEFAHNLYGRADIVFERDDFLESAREDDNWGGQVGLRYLHNPRFESQFGLSYRNRSSNEAGRDYDQMLIRYGLVSRF